ncbi:unnamed protein product [Closterium sp. NIES-53]
MIHAATPHFLWPFAVRYAAHQLNLWPRVSLPETSPTLLWTGKVGDASRFRVWGARAFVRDTATDKLSARAVPCIFLGFVPDAPGWQFYHPTSRCVFPSQDVTFDESVPFYRVSQVDPPPLSAPVEVTGDSGPARGAASGGAEPGGVEPKGDEPGGAKPGGAEVGGAEPGDAETGGTESGGAEPGGTESGGAAPKGLSRLLLEWYVGRQGRAAGARGLAARGAGAGDSATGAAEGAGAGGSGAAGGAGAGGAGAGGFGAAAGAGAEGSESTIARSPWKLRAPEVLSVGAATTTRLVPPFVAGSSATSPTARLSFTLDSGASCCFFRDCTDLTPLHTPVTVALANPSIGSVVAESTTTLPCPAAPSGFLTGYYTPSFSRNLVGVSHLHDLGVVTTFPLQEPVASCVVGDTEPPLATFHREPSSGLYSLHTGSGQVRMVRHRLVSGLPESLAPLPRSPVPPCTPYVEGRQRAAPHSSSFPPTTAPLQTLHLESGAPPRSVAHVRSATS